MKVTFVKTFHASPRAHKSLTFCLTKGEKFEDIAGTFQTLACAQFQKFMKSTNYLRSQK